MYKFEFSKKEINKISNILLQPEGLIAFPTDTVWGVGCLVNNKCAVERIYSIKERPKNKPLILLSNKLEYLSPYVSKINNTAKKIIEKYWPGAVTIILPKSNLTPDYVTSGFNTVGIRIPSYVPLLELLDKCIKNHVIAHTSANISGTRTSICRANVEDDLGDYLDYILDDYGFEYKEVESTVVLINDDESFKILRQGAVKIEI